MNTNHSTQDKGLKLFRSKKVLTLAELTLHMQCSTRTVQRRLAEWQAISSYNRNGGCYTLPDIASFDSNGLWHHKGVYFSKFGTLSETFVRLVADSRVGLRAADAGELLGVRPSSFLSSLRNHPNLVREKHQGLYVYFCSELSRYECQRLERNIEPEKVRLPTDFEAIAILVEKIKHPTLNNKDLSQRLEKQRVSVRPESIETLFFKHDLKRITSPHSI